MTTSYAVLTQATITPEILSGYRNYLTTEELAASTIEKYLSAVTRFAAWLGIRPLDKIAAIEWRNSLQGKYSDVTINAMVSGLNNLFKYMNRLDCHLKFLEVREKNFQEESRILTKAEYEKLLATAEAAGKIRLKMIMLTLGSTGVRASELRFFTVEAIERKVITIRNKGATRQIPIGSDLRRELLRYAKKQKITSGPLFITRTGKPLSRRQIWGELKRLSEAAGVEGSKVFPHSFRKLFAREHYRRHRDMPNLSIALGHKSIDTTRIYLKKTSDVFERQMDELGMVS